MMGQVACCGSAMAYFRKNIARAVCVGMMVGGVGWDAVVPSQDGERKFSVLVLWDCGGVVSWYSFVDGV